MKKDQGHKMFLIPSLLIALGLSSVYAQETKPEPDTNVKKAKVTDGHNFRRGNAWEFDPGPAPDSKWIDLIAETPNYLEFGKEVLAGSGDKFRWKMGPMHYRGRLGACEVKVFVVGQEGAQDENVTNRSFTGSTGTRMQKFLNALGIYQSYLFMNTFVYTINSQYTGEEGVPTDLLWLAQNQDSIVVQHRHKMFDNMLELNNKNRCGANGLSLIIGVGTAGKDSVATYLNYKGGNNNCSNSRLGGGYCLGSGPLAGVVAIGVKHPGAASPNNGGDEAGAALRADFKKKWETAKERAKLEPDMLPGSNKLGSVAVVYNYSGYAAIPYRDFAYGSPWIMGEGPTSSNRRGAESIQIFSSEGTYNNEGHNPVYRDPVDRLMSKPKELRTEDVGFEAPKNSDDRYRFDVGPAEKMGRLLFDVYKSVAGKGVSHPSLGPQGAYRGNLNKPKVLFIADQESHTDMFAGRAWTGAMGQKLQTYLKELGLNNAQGKLNTSVIPAEYAIVRTFPVDTLGMTDAQKLIADAYLSAMKELIQAIGAEKMVTIGPDAQKVLVALNISAINLDSNAGNWKAQGSKISAAYTGKFSESELTFIPRLDLPAMSRWWMGTDGDRAARGEGKVETGHYYQVYAPAWSARSRNRLLSPEEKASIAKFPKQ